MKIPYSIPKQLILTCIGLLISIPSQASIHRVKTKAKIVALSFDDGPNPPYTEQLLKILAEKQVHATFFLIGNQIEAHPETAKKILAAGYEVGGHSYDWTMLAFKKKSFVISQLDKMDAAFKNIGITNLVLFRPPNGFLSIGQEKILKKRNLTVISASVIAYDWKETDANKITKTVLKKVRPGSIIALHDGGGNRSATLAAVPKIIDTLRKRGYTILTISELMNSHGNHP
jgi:peptidoglycan/xylan/chitin deacetylase (PgdA/CDA1 family)